MLGRSHRLVFASLICLFCGHPLWGGTGQAEPEPVQFDRLAPEADVFMAVGTGRSMSPELVSGSRVYFEAAPFGVLKQGDWIAYRTAAGRVITHALRVRSGNGWYAIGLANHVVDTEWVHAGNYLGRVFAVIPPPPVVPSGIEIVER